MSPHDENQENAYHQENAYQEPPEAPTMGYTHDGFPVDEYYMRERAAMGSPYRARVYPSPPRP